METLDVIVENLRVNMLNMQTEYTNVLELLKEERKNNKILSQIIDLKEKEIDRLKIKKNDKKRI